MKLLMPVAVIFATNDIISRLMKNIIRFRVFSFFLFFFFFFFFFFLFFLLFCSLKKFHFEFNYFLNRANKSANCYFIFIHYLFVLLFGAKVSISVHALGIKRYKIYKGILFRRYWKFCAHNV